MNFFRWIKDRLFNFKTEKEKPMMVRVKHLGEEIELPLFVTGGLRLKPSGYVNEWLHYYRDGGNWEVSFNIVKTKFGRKIISKSNVSTVNGWNLKPMTYKEWEKDNGQYAPDLSTVIYDIREYTVNRIEIKEYAVIN